MLEDQNVYPEEFSSHEQGEFDEALEVQRSYYYPRPRPRQPYYPYFPFFPYFPYYPYPRYPRYPRHPYYPGPGYGGGYDYDRGYSDDYRDGRDDYDRDRSGRY